MKITRENLVNLINSEIIWCQKHTGVMSDEFVRGYIKGLKEAVYLIGRLESLKQNKILRKK